MAVTDIILNSGEVVVILSDSILDIVAVDNSLNFGTVQAVNQLSDKTTVGQSVLFNIKKAVPFQIISGTTFYKVNEDDLQFSETPL